MSQKCGRLTSRKRPSGPEDALNQAERTLEWWHCASHQRNGKRHLHFLQLATPDLRLL